MEYCKDIEREVYIKVLEKICKERVESNYTNGICYLVREAYLEVTGVKGYIFSDNGGIKKFCPTFLKRKPLWKDKDQYWWPTRRFGERVILLESCIRELNRGRKLNIFERIFRIFP